MSGDMIWGDNWPKAVIFDLDGTLVDSAPDIRLAVNAAFAPLGVPPFELEAVRRLIGGGAAKALRRATIAAGLQDGDVDQGALLERFMPVYLAESIHGRGLYPGAHDLLTGLQKRKLPMAICTNKAQPVTDAVVDTLDIRRYCHTVIGALHGVAKKPDPTILHQAMAAMEVDARDVAMVGDSSADVGAAKAAGVPIIVMSYGYTPKPHDLGADLVINHLQEVPAALARLAAR